MAEHNPVVTPDHPVIDAIPRRWSPYGYDQDRDVEPEQVRIVFEAARWAPSSFNEQPWRYIVARKSDDEATWSRILGCLVEANREWARNAPVLALGVTRLRFSKNDKDNRVARHDLGIASGYLALQAAAIGLQAHQMAGIDQEGAKAEFGVPDPFEVVTAVALGHPAALEDLSKEIRDRDEERKGRSPLGAFVFGGTWGTASDLVRG